MDFTVLILLLPFVSFLWLGLGGRWMKPRTAGAIGTASLALVTALAWVTAACYFGGGRTADGTFPTLMPFNFTWLPFTESLHIDFGILLDPISVMMLVVISTVSLMVHIYSLGYMKGEHGYQRYFAFLSLFTLSMTGLVVATNIFQMYVFWELVGVSSYLLIGFYYPRATAVAAAKKAFVVTRFADLGFLAGILIYGYYTGSFAFTPQTQALTAAGMAVPLALGLMFIGGAGKSAMFPLHIWLPDAMEGPTPVSALIHAATMVVSGVYLIARMFPLCIGSAPDVLHLAGYVGAFTALFAAVVACTQTDIKRVLAFSTISQIGFMIVALGVCTSADPHGGGLGYMASLFHLFTHAFFKALLFLCAGAVIHAVHSNEMKDMGGLWKHLPVTHVTFLVACLAIAGIPPFSGFFSKDEILTACFRYSPAIGVLMSGTAMLTAFYMFRLYFRIFRNRAYDTAHHTPHEAPRTMTVPLIVLAVLTCVAGWIPFGRFVSSNGEAYTIHLNAVVAAVSICAAAAAIGLAAVIYGKANGRSVTRFRGLYRAAYRRFYIDEVYQFVTHRIIFACISAPLAWFDRHVVDGFMNGLARVTNTASVRIRGLQSGNVQQYTMVFLSGALILIVILLLARSGSVQTQFGATRTQLESIRTSDLLAGATLSPQQERRTLPGKSDTLSPAGATYSPRQEWHSPTRPVTAHVTVRLRHTQSPGYDTRNRPGDPSGYRVQGARQCRQVKKLLKHKDTEHTEKYARRNAVFSPCLSLQDQTLHKGHREGTSFLEETNLRVLRVSVFKLSLHLTTLRCTRPGRCCTLVWSVFQA